MNAVPVRPRAIQNAMPGASAIAQREERFRSVFAQAALPQAIACVDDARYVAVNRLYAELLGYDEAELLTLTVPQVTHPKDRKRNQALFDEVLRRGGPSHAVFEKRYVRKDGEIVHVRNHLSVVRDDSHRPRYLHAVVEDLTRQRAVELSLVESEARFRALVEHSDQMLLLLDPDGTVRYASPNAAWLLGVERSTGWSLFDRVPAASAPALREALTRMVLEREDGVELHLQTGQGGERRSWDVRLRNRLDRPALEGVLAVLQDVSDRVQDAAVAEGEARVLRMLLAGSSEQETLRAIVRLVEEQVPAVRCTVLRVEDGRLRHVAAPSMPPEFGHLVDGIPVGPDQGSCGTAAHTGAPVVSEDLRTSEQWRDYQHLVDVAGVRSCWSLPIRGVDGEVVGTFAIYGVVPRRPSEREWELCQRLSAIAGFVLAAGTGGPLRLAPDGEATALAGRLTTREREVLRLIALGHTSDEMAQLLRIGLRTVETHRASIYRKTGLRTRAELVRLALDAGFVNAASR